ncbi:MAG: glutamyl-tRNA reductase [Deltaproteobacteria bacterium]|nr:glutamyl-tRNA reductase [Deltaproteobacteria bacterium]NND30437.1 glutamyl-tRNA reductase [Myxococcales bacterium]MBT8466794.1 glutamyl-tRNA reductase [Deltaproteobacteria bacterium]NNK09355.1 glutamyl-tRNA reductase [Myxococcales bacterium]NNK42067.1 glutamyl-tRNA reductase [Myxococcales bacterium]
MRDFVVVGLSHRTAPVEVRERLAVPPHRLRDELLELSSSERLDEALLISTCNRVELYATSTDPVAAAHSAKEAIAGRLSKLAPDDVLYQERGIDAVRHVFRVASSLDSLVVGEPQILGQVKEAFDAAKEAGTVGTLLGRCFTQAFATAKRVRRETGIAEGTVSVSSIACELAKKIFGNLDGRRTLLLGAGEMGESAARSLRQTGTQLHVVNRSDERAERLAEACGGRAVSYERLSLELAQADVVIASTASEKFILTPELMKGVVRTRRHRPLFIIDIAVPRDVDPRIASMDNVFVYDVDDLQQVAEENLSVRAREAARAEQIVEEEVEAFLSWRRSLELAPTIVALRERFGQIATEELERALPRLHGTSPSDRAVLEAMGRSLVNKLLHEPMTQLKAGAGEPDGALLIDAVRRLFDLSAEQSAAKEASTEEPQDAAVAQLAPAAATGSTGESK